MGVRGTLLLTAMLFNVKFNVSNYTYNQVFGTEVKIMWGTAITWLTKCAFKPVLEELAKEAAKDWVKDFFKGLPEGISKRLLQIILPSARDKAIKGFLQLVQKELEADGLDKHQVKQYTQPLNQFLKKESVREILGSAFQRDCKTIDAVALARIWKESNLKDLPGNFNWDLVMTPYYRKVSKIRRDSTLQDLEPKQIQEFIEKWHELAFCKDGWKMPLQTLKRLPNSLETLCC